MNALRPPEQDLGHAGEWCARHVPSVVPSLSPAGQPSTSAHLKSFIHLAKATTFNWINLLGRFSVRKLVFFSNAVPHHSGPLQKPLFSVIVIYSGFNQLNEQSKWMGWHPVNVLKSTMNLTSADNSLWKNLRKSKITFQYSSNVKQMLSCKLVLLLFATSRRW